MGRGQTITMSRKETARLGVIEQASKGELGQADAASRLGISIRQVKRLVKRFRESGAQGLVSRKRGKPSNNKLDPTVVQQVQAIVQENYSDFGPTLAWEKLTQIHDLNLSRESVRQIMIQGEIWTPKRRKKIKIHQSRERRPCFGDMIQIDGSPHDWFEGRGPYCTLIVWIDDATSKLVALRFMPSETTFGYLDILRDYLDTHGVPVSFYSDKHSIFRQNANDGEGEETQFTQALRRLAIEPIHANTPQAKGRVERANKTLQDRLVKELRLAGISTIEEANAFLPEFMAKYNKQFAKPARSPEDSHRPCELTPMERDIHCATHTTRVLSKNLTIRYKNTEYQLREAHHERRLRHKKITVVHRSNDEIILLCEGKVLEYRTLSVGEPPIPLDDEKTLTERVDEAKRRRRISVTKGRKPDPSNPFNKSPERPTSKKKSSQKSSARDYDRMARYYA